jgi:hypothetical protein
MLLTTHGWEKAGMPSPTCSRHTRFVLAVGPLPLLAQSPPFFREDVQGGNSPRVGSL